jgi:hypothetical protein
MPNFFEKSPLSAAEKHRQDKGTSCYQNDTTNINFDDGWNQQTPNISQKVNIFSEFYMCNRIGLNRFAVVFPMI